MNSETTTTQAPPHPPHVHSPVRHTVLRGEAAQVRWGATAISERVKLIGKLRVLIAEHAAALAQASAGERRRPVSEAMAAEVIPLAEACRFLEKNAAKLLEPRTLGRRGLPLWLMPVRTEIHRQALGVILIIGPGNYPLLLPGIQMVQALAAGNAVVLKPAPGGMPAALALAELVYQAGFEKDLVAVIPQTVEAVKEAIAAGPSKVIFTGSSETGAKIQAQLAPRNIPSIMELSGEDAVIVRADADLALAAKAIAFGLTINDGATCLAPRRLIAHAGIIERLTEGIIAELNAREPIRVSREMAERFGGQIEALLNEGGRLVHGKLEADGESTGPFLVACEREQFTLPFGQAFAPLLVIVRVINDSEAIACANSSSYALGASIFSADVRKAGEMAGKLKAGSVSINDLIVPTADARVPFGGVGQSGFGSTRGAEGLLELTAPKVVTVTRGTFRPAYDKPRAEDAMLFETYLTFSHGSSGFKRLKALGALLKRLIERK